MKKYILALVAFATLAVSCNKLDIAPRGELTDKIAAYQNETTRSQILAGIYAYLYHDATWGSVISQRLEAATDVAISRSQNANVVENNSHSATTFDDTWAVMYQAINAANEFIYFANTYAPESKQRNQEIGEARFLRSFFYFTLVRMFGDVPFRTDPQTNLNNTDIARTSAVEIYNFIIKELKDVEKILADPETLPYGHIGKTVAQTTLADVYLNLGGYLMINRQKIGTKQELYNEAAKWCRKVLASPAHDINATEYINVFKHAVRQEENLKEQIWELQTKYQRTENGYNTDTRLGKYNGIGGKIDDISQYAADAWIYQSATLRPLYGKIEESDIQNDQRAVWNATIYKMGRNTKFNNPDSVLVTTHPANVFQFYAGKWRTIYAKTIAESASKSWSGARLSMYRIAEVHLMLAEALNEGENNQAEAIEQVNIVRRRAHATEVSQSLSQAEVLELIIDERARELCFEGKRRFDLIRWGIYAEKIAELAPLYYGAENEGWVRDKKGVFDNFNPEMHYILPIPQAEISRNALIPESEQNEGWGGSRKWR